mmetsp:Transcript_103986/g.293280  ORF Transcript_103986/g.293280 Transcript_103986/m.293280 type:complete len:307 (+) Transcript_103986:287-1207(+)
MLEGVALHGKDRLNAENCAPGLGHLPEHLHPLAKLLRDDLALAYDRHRIHAAVMPTSLRRVAMAMAVSVSSGAMAAAVAALVPTAMAMVLGASRLVVAMPVAMAFTMATMVIMAAMACPMLAVAVLVLGHCLLLYVGVREARHVVGPHVCQLAHFDAAFHGGQNLREGVDGAQTVLDDDGLIRRYKVQLVQQDLIAECHLLISLVHLALLYLVVEAPDDVLRVCDSNHAIQAQLARNLLAGHERPDDGHRVSHASGLDQNGVELAAFVDFVEDLPESRQEVTPNSAAHAAVVHDDNLLGQCELVLL